MTLSKDKGKAKMKTFKEFLVEKSNTGLGAEGLSKAKLKNLLYKSTKKCTYNKLYKDEYWQGPKCIWNTFDSLDLNWNITGSEYKKYHKENKLALNDTKEWTFDIMWDDNKGKHKKISGLVTAAGAGSVSDPLDRYDVNMVIF